MTAHARNTNLTVLFPRWMPSWVIFVLPLIAAGLCYLIGIKFFPGDTEDMAGENTVTRVIWTGGHAMFAIGLFSGLLLAQIADFVAVIRWSIGSGAAQWQQSAGSLVTEEMGFLGDSETARRAAETVSKNILWRFERRGVQYAIVAFPIAVVGLYWFLANERAMGNTRVGFAEMFLPCMIIIVGLVASFMVFCILWWRVINGLKRWEDKIASSHSRYTVDTHHEPESIDRAAAQQTPEQPGGPRPATVSRKSEPEEAGSPAPASDAGRIGPKITRKRPPGS